MGDRFKRSLIFIGPGVLSALIFWGVNTGTVTPQRQRRLQAGKQQADWVVTVDAFDPAKYGDGQDDRL